MENQRINLKNKKTNPFEGLLVEQTKWTGQNHFCSCGNTTYEVWYMGNFLGEAERDWDYFGIGWDQLDIFWF